MPGPGTRPTSNGASTPATTLVRVAIARAGALSDDVGVAPAPWLCESERVRWRTLNPGARAAFVASRMLLRQLLEAATGEPFRAWSVSAEPGLAPRAHAAGRASDPIRVSLSHRLDWVAAAVSDTAVGIDLECDRPARSDPRERAVLMLSPEELDEWGRVPAGDREAALLARWTLKEAWFKAAPPPSAPWDFRRVQARACAPAHANARTWRAPPVHVALACADARALSAARCDGLPAMADEAFWHVAALA